MPQCWPPDKREGLLNEILKAGGRFRRIRVLTTRNKVLLERFDSQQNASCDRFLRQVHLMCFNEPPAWTIASSTRPVL